MNTTATATRKACTCSLVVAFAEDGTEITTGCTATTKRTFAPGHDARLKGFLIRAGRENMLVRVGEDVNTSAQAVADQFGFGYMVREGIARPKATRKAKAPAPKVVTAKVGRWEYEGTLRANGTEFVYTNRKGEQLVTCTFRLA